MPEHLEVLFYILGDLIDDNFYMQIIESVNKITGITSIIHTKDTNTVEVSAKWAESEFDARIEEIRKIPNVKKIKIFKKTRLITRSLTDHVEISERVEIKTIKARKISKILESSIIQRSSEMNIRIKFLIFGPGKNSKEYMTYRLPLKKLIENKMHQIANFPEEINDKSENILIKEYSLMTEYDYTIILLMSAGAISEFSTFFTKRAIVNKIRLFILKKHSRSGSYLATGPIRIFKGYSKHVYIFCQPEDLLTKATKMIIDILAYEIFVKFH